jgi:hypothetical protein
MGEEGKSRIMHRRSQNGNDVVENRSFVEEN